MEESKREPQVSFAPGAEIMPDSPAPPESHPSEEEGLEVAEPESDVARTLSRHRFESAYRLSLAVDKGVPTRLSTKAALAATEGAEQDSIDDSESAAGTLRYLKYGDKIRLRVTGSGGVFHVFSDGFATKRVYMRQSEAGVEGSRKKERIEEVFRVMPKSDFGTLAQLRQDLKALLRSKKASGGSSTAPMVADDGYANRTIEEAELNQKRYESLLGQPVHYYESIQLVHEETQQFVSVSKNVELSPKDLDAGKDGQAETELRILLRVGIKKDIMRVYSLKLVPYSSATTHFVLIPCHRYQESGYILEEDFFYFAYADAKLLGKRFHLYFPQAEMGKSTGRAHNAYLYDEIKTSMKYESVPERAGDHLFRELNRKAVWITHIEAPLLLCLEKVEKSTEQEGNELGELIEPAGEAVSQSFSLSFRQYDPEAPLTSNGLWLVVPRGRDKRQVVFKHLLYLIREIITTLATTCVSSRSPSRTWCGARTRRA